MNLWIIVVPFFFFCFFLLLCCDPTRVMASSFLRFPNHTRRTTVGRTPLDKWSPGRRDLYLTTHNTHNRQISMPLVGFEPMISAGEQPQTYALDRAATGTGIVVRMITVFSSTSCLCVTCLVDIINQHCNLFAWYISIIRNAFVTFF